MKKLYEAIASACDARANCRVSGNDEWFDRWDARLDSLDKMLPSGSGFDSGSKVDRDKSNGSKLVIETSYHHMNETGMYGGWTEHKVTIKPDLIHGFTVEVSGRDRNELKDYAAEVFGQVLLEEVAD